MAGHTDHQHIRRKIKIINGASFIPDPVNRKTPQSGKVHGRKIMKHLDEYRRAVADPSDYVRQLKNTSGRKIIGYTCSYIDKNFLFVGRSILSAVLCVKNILPQDVGCCMDDTAEGIWQNSFY